uniref:C2H2-type domain-containing protein n=1 Tax=Chenopodium quinoa TaxID=63459 RepID=A0A803KQG9_CHEQI
MKSNNTIGFLWVLPFFMLTISANFGISAAQPLHHQDQGLNENAESRDLKKEHEHIYEVHCSRERSRAAWETVDKYLMHFVERERYKIPRSCRLHPDNDLFRDQEQHKIKMDVNEWQCGYCKKSFLSEEFLDRHFDSRHYNLLNFTGSKCLADLCGALHCDHVLNTKSPKAKCNHAAAARNRHLCESLADACFPVTHGPSASRLHEGNKSTVFCRLNIDYNVTSSFLCFGVFAPEDNGDSNFVSYTTHWSMIMDFEAGTTPYLLLLFLEKLNLLQGG